MAALNYIQAIHDRFWGIVEAHAPTAGKFRLGNRLKLNKPTPDAKPSSRQPADYLELILRPTTGTDSAFATPETFGELDSSTGWEFDVTQSFEAKITHDTLELDAEAELELLTALRLSGRQLSLSGSPLAYVVTWGPIATARTEELVANRLRVVTRFGFPVNMKFTYAQLTT
jgi:hypothetical protein